MREMFTTNPDDGCREVESGIYGRPVRTDQEGKFLKAGWSYSVSQLRGADYGVRKDEKEGREEEGEVESQFSKDAEELERYALEIEYKQRFGKRVHHKMKTETIRQKLEESDD